MGSKSVFFIVDIDECSYFSNLCINGECENTLGMFRCRCNQGFKQDATGGNCTGEPVYFIGNNINIDIILILKYYNNFVLIYTVVSFVMICFVCCRYQ